MNPYNPFQNHLLICTICHSAYHYQSAYRYKCDCGGTLMIQIPTIPKKSKTSNRNLFDRYQHWWGLPDEFEYFTLGEGRTPIVPFRYRDRNITGKLEYLSPSGSYKDRGAALMISVLKYSGVKELIEDSSGNAGGSIAAYSTAAGINCSIYCPDTASGAKLSFIKNSGAKLNLIEGGRENAAKKALEEAEQMVYGSHVWNPWFMAGVRSIAYEIAEDYEMVPEEIIMPLGNGALLLGVYQGFCDLLHAGLIKKIPKLIGVQAVEVSPIFHLWLKIPYQQSGKTIAEGIANAAPPRALEIVNAIHHSEGKVMVATEQEIIDAWKSAQSSGILIEPTSAVVLAAEMQLSPNPHRLHIFTGSVLKTPGLLLTQEDSGSNS